MKNLEGLLRLTQKMDQSKIYFSGFQTVPQTIVASNLQASCPVETGATSSLQSLLEQKLIFSVFLDTRYYLSNLGVTYILPF